MKKIEEYIFYRVYVYYKKKDDIPLFSSTLYIATIYISLSLFICGTFANLFKNKEYSYDKWIFVLCYSIMIIRVFKKYYNKRIRDNILMSNSMKKNIFPNWFYFLILPLIGVLLYIFSYMYIIKQFNLEGIILQKIILQN